MVAPVYSYPELERPYASSSRFIYMANAMSRTCIDSMVALFDFQTNKRVLSIFRGRKHHN